MKVIKVKDVKNLLRDLRRKNNCSIVELARESNLAPVTISVFERNESDFDMNYIQHYLKFVPDKIEFKIKDGNQLIDIPIIDYKYREVKDLIISQRKQKNVCGTELVSDKLTLSSIRTFELSSKYNRLGYISKYLNGLDMSLVMSHNDKNYIIGAVR